MSPRLIASGVVVLLVAILAMQNHEPVTVDLLVWDVTLSRSLLIAGVFACGYVAGWLTKAWTALTRG